MGFSSQAGHLLLRTQDDAGVFQDDIVTDGVAMRLRGGSMGPSRDLMIPDAEIGGNRDVADAYLGPVSWSGSYDFYVRVDSLTTLLQGAFGNIVTPAIVSGVTTCTFTPSDGAQLPFLSAEEEIGAGLECFDYTDAVVNTFHLEAAADGYLMGTVGLIAKMQTAGITPTDVTDLVDETNLIVGTNITVTYNSITVVASDFKFDFNNNVDDTFYKLGSLYLADLTPKRREVTASFTVREQDSDLWRQATYGTSSAVTAGGITDKKSLVIVCSTYEFIAASSTPRSVTITMPKFALKPYDFAPNADDVIDNEVDGQAMRPAPGTPICTIVTKSGNAAIA